MKDPLCYVLSSVKSSNIFGSLAVYIDNSSKPKHVPQTGNITPSSLIFWILAKIAIVFYAKGERNYFVVSFVQSGASPPGISNPFNLDRKKSIIVSL